jgi:hypothetical protein
MTFKVLMGSISAIVSFVSFIPYLRTAIQGKTKPHFFTWLVWSILLTIIFIIQVKDGAGAGSWGTGVIALTTICIGMYSWFYGVRTGSKLDWFALIFSLTTIPLWLFTEDPTFSACLATFIDVVAFYPTVSKTWNDPQSEDLSYYVAWLIKYPTAFLAIEKMSTANAVYPVTWTVIGVAFVLFIIYRRKIKT